MIYLIDVEPRCIVCRMSDTVDHKVYHKRPRFTCRDLRFYMRRGGASLEGRYAPLVNVVMNAAIESGYRAVDVVDHHKPPRRRDRRSNAMKEAHSKTRRMI